MFNSSPAYQDYYYNRHVHFRVSYLKPFFLSPRFLDILLHLHLFCEPNVALSLSVGYWLLYTNIYCMCVWSDWMNELPVSICFTVISVGFPLSKQNMVCMQTTVMGGGCWVLMFCDCVYYSVHTWAHTHAHKNKFDLLLMEIVYHFRYLTSGKR